MTGDGDGQRHHGAAGPHIPATRLACLRLVRVIVHRIIAYLVTLLHCSLWPASALPLSLMLLDVTLPGMALRAMCDVLFLAQYGFVPAGRGGRQVPLEGGDPTESPRQTTANTHIEPCPTLT